MMRFASIGSRRRRAHEAREQAQAHRAALLGMELDPQHPLSADRRPHPAAVLDVGDDRPLVDRLRRVGVHEIEVRGVGDIREPRVRADQPQLIPARVRDTHGPAQLSDSATVEAKTRRRRVLLALLEEELHPHAEAENREAPLARPADRLIQAEAAQLTRAVAEVSDAREHDRARREDLFSIAGDADVSGARTAQRALDVREVADAVVHDRDHPMRPLELGTPSRRGSRRAAASSARPNALKAASRRWWVLPPRSCETCTVQRAPCVNAMKKSGTSVESNEPTMRVFGLRSWTK